MGRVKLAGAGGLSVEGSGGGEGGAGAAGALEDPVARGDLDHGGRVMDTFLIARGVTAVAEGAAGRGIDGAGDIACGEVALRAVGGVWDGDGAEEGARVGVERASGDGFGGSDFHDAAEVHDGDAGGDVADDGEVVGDE